MIIKRILFIPDTHAPFQHEDALDFLRDVAKEVKPEEIIHLGDELDNHSLSMHPKSPECPGAEDEARGGAEFIEQLGKLFPRVKVCVSNHIERLWKQASRNNIPRRFIRDWKDAINAPRGWQWADEWQLGEIRAFHGDGYLGKSAIENAVIDAGCNVVFGHLHSQGSVEHHRRNGWQYWGMCAGCLIDPNSPAMSYGKHHRKKLVLGCGLVIDGVPMFRPLV